MNKEAKEEGYKRREQIFQTAQQEAERIRLFTRQEIEMLKKARIRELKEYTAEQTTALAQETIQNKLTNETQSFLIDKSIKKIEILYESSNSDK